MPPRSAAAVGSRIMLLFGENEVEWPAAANVRPWPAKVTEDLGFPTASLFQGVSQNGEAVVVQQARGQLALLIGCLGETEYGVFIPGKACRFNADGAGGVAHDVPHKRSLPTALQPNARRLLLCRGLANTLSDTPCDHQHIAGT